MPLSTSAADTSGRLLVPSFCSPGTILDRVSILRMKAANFRNPAQLSNVQHELELLASAWAEVGYPPWHEVAEYTDIADITGWLWELENRARLHEANRDFGARFRATIRTIQHLNSYRESIRITLDASFVARGYPPLMETTVGADAYLDGVAILAVKAKRAASEDRRESARLQKSACQTLWAKLGLPDAFDTPDYAMLSLANERIWDTKDALVEAEAAKHFDDAYVRAGRSLYIVNDRRAQLKKRVAMTYNSEIRDEKNYILYSLPEDWDPDQLTWRSSW
jgi:hypothetical protein